MCRSKLRKNCVGFSINKEQSAFNWVAFFLWSYEIVNFEKNKKHVMIEMIKNNIKKPTKFIYSFLFTTVKEMI